MADKSLKLNDGRKLSYAEYGDLNGKPVFHFHGSAGSRLEHPNETILMDLGIRYISTDRPGHGLSDPQKNRKLLNWPDDISELADSLKIQKFYVIGWSAGGPYALACAYKLPERILRGAIVSGFAPTNRPNPTEGYGFFPRLFMFSAHHFHKLIYLFRRMGYSQVASGKEIKIDCMTSPDKGVMENPENYQKYVADMKEGYKQGWRGVALDDIIINNPWDFKLSDIKIPIDIWQGTEDQNVPPSQGRYQHEKIPMSRLMMVENQAHLYLLAHWQEVLSKLVENRKKG